MKKSFITSGPDGMQPFCFLIVCHINLGFSHIFLQIFQPVWRTKNMTCQQTFRYSLGGIFQMYTIQRCQMVAQMSVKSQIIGDLFLTSLKLALYN